MIAFWKSDLWKEVRKKTAHETAKKMTLAVFIGALLVVFASSALSLSFKAFWWSMAVVPLGTMAVFYAVHCLRYATRAAVLAYLLNQSYKDLCGQDFSMLEKFGEWKLRHTVDEILAAEEDERILPLATVNVGGGRELVREATRSNSAWHRGKLKELYDTLVEFHLTNPDGYGWVFKEQKKNRPRITTIERILQHDR